jgi:F420H(2)-dependent quinone reductase
MSLTGQVLRVHEALYKATDGRVGHGMIGVPCLLLRTTGRKSGQTRTISLVYARDGDDYVVVASKGGADENPAWLLNLRANPDVEVQVGRKRQKARAREVTSADPDYQRLWKLVNDNNRGRYDGYQKLTQREIPLAVLTPV